MSLFAYIYPRGVNSMKVFCIVKVHLIYYILLILLMVSSTYAFEEKNGNKLSNKVIVVDAGHGGIDSGATRPGVDEKDINLAVALQLKNILNQKGAKVIMSRQTDIELSNECDNEKVRGRYHRDLMARVEMVEESDADLFVSLHANAVRNDKKRGAEVFYYNKSEAGKTLANLIQTELCNVTGISCSVQNADYFVLRRNKIPAVLIELGYITNTEERQLLLAPDYQQKLARAIAEGICKFY
ncbi:N-acetylmuramoyl-L-alanine amidase [Propionispora hippei DSM 15287]|uniref:N-acetylmuramoyl-L-alanine amidase n=2 Tax=Propionispora TaxID=112902 RepID=A0A1M6CYH8_9FIRM|nr:N-acetylmuramoyl-L-alanine amidase [Propionispora hippei DSM 15287]